MKINKGTSSILLLTAILLVAVSCLEDKGYTDLVNGVGKKPVVSWYGNNPGFSSFGFLPSDDEQDLDLIMTIAPITKPLTITVEIDEAALTEYNNQLIEEGIAHGDTLADGSPDFDIITQYELLDASAFRIVSNEVLVEPGQIDYAFTVKVISNNIDLSGSYMLPLTITSVTGGDAVIAYGLKTALAAIQVRNQYDGLYTKTGNRYDFNSVGDVNQSSWPPTGYTVDRPFNFTNEPVLTVNSNTVSVSAGNSNGGFGYMNVTVNPDNSLSIDGSGVGLNAFMLNPNYPSYYDPTTKTFHLYTQWTNTNGTHRLVYETLTFTGNRP